MSLGRLNGYSEPTLQHLPVRFHQGVQAGPDAAARDGFLPTSEVWSRVECALKARARAALAGNYHPAAQNGCMLTSACPALAGPARCRK
jgi:hypothetical protein